MFDAEDQRGEREEIIPDEGGGARDSQCRSFPASLWPEARISLGTTANYMDAAEGQADSTPTLNTPQRQVVALTVWLFAEGLALCVSVNVVHIFV